jgi:hypothetical protein
LHYLGVYKVFLEADGSLSLGEKEPDARVAVDTLVEARLGELRSAISSALTNVGASTAANGPAAAAQFDIDTAGFPDAVGSSVVKVKS